MTTMHPFASFLPPHKPLALCIGENPPPLADTNLFVRDFAPLAPLLEKVGAKYDLICMDCDLVDTRPILSACGNLVIFSKLRYTSPIQLNRCWLHVERDGTHAYYYANEHTGGPCPTEDPQAWLTHRKGALVDRTNACHDTPERHTAAVQELGVRNDWGSRLGMFDITHVHPSDHLNLHFSPRAFPLFSRTVPLLQKHWMKLFEQRALPHIMRNPSDRAMLRSITTSQHWRIHPFAMKLIQTAFSEHAQIHAPFTAQTEPQRLAWLDEVATVRRRDGTPALLSAEFPEAKDYPVRVAFCDTEGDTQRPASDGTAEEVTLHGRTMIAIVIDEQGREHRFGYQCKQTWADFLALFHPPEVADIAALHPEKYQEAKHWLIQFAHKLTTKNEPAPAA